MLPPAAYGSIGDDAMVRGLVGYLRNAKPDWSVDLFSSCSGQRWPWIEGLHEVLTSFPLQEGAIQQAFFSRYDILFLFGADVLDGHYSLAESRERLHMVRLAASYGLHTTILGSSVNENFDGLMEIFESGDFLLSPRSFDASSFQRRCMDLMSELDEISSRVRKNLPRALELAQANFQHLIG